MRSRRGNRQLRSYEHSSTISFSTLTKMLITWLFAWIYRRPSTHLITPSPFVNWGSFVSMKVLLNCLSLVAVIVRKGMKLVEFYRTLYKFSLISLKGGRWAFFFNDPLCRRHVEPLFSKCFGFADDAKLNVSVARVYASAQEDLDALNQWSLGSQSMFHRARSRIVKTFKQFGALILGSAQIVEREEIKNMGITLAHDLKRSADIREEKTVLESSFTF